MRTNQAHKQTDIILEQLEHKLRNMYQRVYTELKSKMAVIMGKIEFAADLTPIQRYNLACKYDRLAKLEKEMLDGLKDAANEAVKMINNEMVTIYKINRNFEAARLGTSSLFSKQTAKGILMDEATPFTKLAIDSFKNSELIRRELSGELLNSVMQGESIYNMATRFRGVVERNLKDCIRIARTETTRVESFARWSVGKKAEKAGLKVVKEWVATKDSRTREWHNEADGQQVPLDEPFIVGDEELMYPGDPNGSAENVINCRCTMINVVLDVNK